MKKNFLFLLLFVNTHFLFAQWSSDPVTGGKIVNNAIAAENYQVSVTDGTNGSIVIFESSFNGSVNNLYAQRINSNGQLLWGLTNNPKPVCLHSEQKLIEQVIPDGNGGVFISWFDDRNSIDSSDMYLQHLNSNGDPLWPANGIMVNNNNDREAYEIRLCSDGNGGVIVVWSEDIYDTDFFVTTYSQIFAQKYTSAGVAQWGDGGLEICAVDALRANPSIVTDGSGGAIISFADTRNSNQAEDDIFDNIDIYAQRISSAGALLWTDNGAPVNTQPNNQRIDGELFQTTSSMPDGSGGVIILFDSYLPNDEVISNYYVQHLNGTSAMQWAAAGFPVCVSNYEKFLVKLQPDGAGGLAAFWSEDRQGAGISSSYGQRILTNGSANWAVNGIKLIDNDGYALGNDFINDGSGNYVFSWITDENHLVAQKINAAGAIQWGVTNKEVCTNPNAFPFFSKIVKSDAGNFIITWLDSRNFGNSSSDIYAAKIDSNGYLVGPPNPNAYVTVANGNWNVGATWLGGVVPPANADVSVRHVVNVTINTTCHSVRVEPKANLTVNTGISFILK
jgi:hypothetical protein